MEDRYYLVSREDLGVWGNRSGSTKKEILKILMGTDTTEDLVVIKGIDMRVTLTIEEEENGN